MTQRRWNRQRIIVAIQERQQRGLKLTDVDEHDVGLAQAARAYFGRWSAAVQAAGFTPAYPKWNQQRVLEAVLERRRQGLSLQRAWSSDRALYLAAHRHFGSWQDALEAAGVKGRRRQRWSRQRVLTELRIWHRASTGNIRKQNPPLTAAITKYFGSLQCALHAAGLESRRAKWSKRRVIEAIQDLYVQKPSRKKGSDPALRSAAQRRFGSWPAALRAAGVEPRVFERWTPERVVGEIQAWHGQGLSLTSVWRENPRLFVAGQRYFGGWHQALRAAGLTPTLRTRAHKK